MMKMQFFLAAMTQLPVAEVFTVPSLLFYAICILPVVIWDCCVVEGVKAKKALSEAPNFAFESFGRNGSVNTRGVMP